MKLDLEKVKFGGKAQGIAEDELSASYMDDAEHKAIDELYRQYVSDGSPKDKAAWLRPQLTDLFRCIDKRPVWVGVLPQWPWVDGTPMVFVRQISVGDTPAEQRELFPGNELYLFALRIKVDEGFKMVYRVIEDDAS